MIICGRVGRRPGPLPAWAVALDRVRGGMVARRCFLTRGVTRHRPASGRWPGRGLLLTAQRLSRDAQRRIRLVLGEPRFHLTNRLTGRANSASGNLIEDQKIRANENLPETGKSTHNPKVAGSNPAPAIEKGPQSGPFCWPSPIHGGRSGTNEVPNNSTPGPFGGDMLLTGLEQQSARWPSASS